ncbi:MAG TPA: alpha/beta hydrolase-fold protein [Rudaea sp.]|nr:alpha/beta hydrolase-fold protein [Rudaea sp.]
MRLRPQELEAATRKWFAGLIAWSASCALGFSSALAQPATADPIFGDGYEGFAPARLIVHYPADTHFVSARGDGGGLSWVQGVTLARTGDTFTRMIEVAAPAQWKPLLDDATAAIGPNYSLAPGQTAEIWPHFTTLQGQVITLIAAFQSTALGNSRAIYAYLPPTYIENTDATFPVVYMHDGQNLWASHPEWSFSGTTWEVDTAFDNAANDGTIKEAVVIGIANDANRLYEYTPTYDPSVPGGGGADLYLQMIVEELKPAVDSMLRTRTDTSSTLMAGSSLGGLVTAYAGYTKPTVFGRIAALSPSAYWDSAVIVSDVQTTPAAPNRPLRVYVDSGDTSADDVTDVNALAAAYVTVGYFEGTDLLHIVQAGGQHNETYWAQRFPGAMQFVLGPRD